MIKKHYKIILILALTVIAYWPVFSADFMYDDRFFVQENAKIREWRFVPEYFANSSRSMASIFWDGIWRPLRTVSYLIDYKVWGPGAFGFHLTSLLWHLLNTLLAYILLGRLFKDQRLRTMACLVFALHPVQTEAVAWISSRGDLMFTAFGLMMFIFYRKYFQTRKKIHLALSLSCFVPALLSKETAVVIPLLIMLYDWLFEGQGRIRALASGWKRYAPYFALALVYLAVRRLALGRVSQCPYWGDSVWTTVLTMFRAALEYVRLLFLPLRLRVDYVYQLSASLLDWRVLGSLAILSGISLLAWRDIKKQRYLAFGWLWLVAGLLPVSNLLPLTAILAERFLYLPLMGFAVWAGYLWSKLENRKLAAAILLFVLAGMMNLTVRRNLEWQDPFSFWTTEVSRSPNSYIAHDYLGNLYYQKGDLPSAERHLLRAVELDSTYFNSLHGLSLVYAKWEKYDQAIIYARKNLSFDPASHDAYITLGISHGGKGDLPGAEEAFKQAVFIDPASKEGWTNLGIIYSQQQMWAKAAEAYSKSIAADPGDPGSYNGLALVLTRQGNAGQAIGFWQRALELDSDHLESRMNLAQALEQTDPAGAAAQWEIFLQATQKLGQPVNREFIGRRIEALKKNEKK